MLEFFFLRLKPCSTVEVCYGVQSFVILSHFFFPGTEPVPRRGERNRKKTTLLEGIWTYMDMFIIVGVVGVSLWHPLGYTPL